MHVHHQKLDGRAVTKSGSCCMRCKRNSTYYHGQEVCQVSYISRSVPSPCPAGHFHALLLRASCLPQLLGPLSQSISTRPGCGQALQIPGRQKRGQTGQELCCRPQLSEPETLLCNGSCSQDASTGLSPRPQKKPNRVFFLEHPRHCW